MPTFHLRVWIPDRPGALGAVASRIGAVKGDLVGIDILERGGGRAIDELVVELPTEDLVPLLLTEVTQVDGVDIEDVRAVPDQVVDPRLDALETAAYLIDQVTVPGLLGSLALRVTHDFQSEWAVVVGSTSSTPVASVGQPPPAAWVAAFVAGSRASIVPTPATGGPDDVAWAELSAADLVVVVGRRGRPFRSRERRQLSAVSRIVDQRWAELVTRSARLQHPSNVPLQPLT